MQEKDYLDQYQSLFAVFNSIYPLSDELKSTIVKNSNVIEVKRKTTLLSAGETSNTIYFIISGGARVYYLNKDGKQTNTWFLFENELLISVYSFFTAQPSLKPWRFWEWGQWIVNFDRFMLPYISLKEINENRKRDRLPEIN